MRKYYYTTVYITHISTLQADVQLPRAVSLWLRRGSQTRDGAARSEEQETLAKLSRARNCRRSKRAINAGNCRLPSHRECTDAINDAVLSDMRPFASAMIDSTTLETEFSSAKEHSHEVPFPVVEYVLLFLIGFVGIVENVAVLCAIVCKRAFRKSSNAFVAHHSFLNLITAAYCIQYGFNVMRETDTPVCIIFGTIFFIALTATAFNIVGITMNEIYLLADDRASMPKETANCFCVVFCILTIWFSSLILHLGITLLPGNPTFIKEVGHCTFKYGQPGNYVLHTMWIGLVSVVLLMAILHLKRYYNEICKPNAADNDANDVQQLILSKNDVATSALRNRRRTVTLHTRRVRKFYTITAIIILFVFFWYPLFLLTLIDPNYQASPLTYKGATIFAGVSCVAEPFALLYLLRCNQTSKPVSTLSASRTTQSLIKSDSVIDSEIFDI